jgi:site-specific recombinase XerD
MDELAKRFFHDPSAYARAVELLSRYEAVENLDWESVEDYLAGLDEGETELLDTALSHRKAVQLQQSHQSLLEKVALLEKTVEALTRSSPPALHNSSIQNKMDAGVVAGGIAPSSSEPSLIKPPPASRDPSQSSSGISISEVDEDDLLLAKVGQKFLDYKRGQVTAGSLTSIQSKVDLFIKILSEHNHNQPLRVSELSNPKIRHFRDTLLKMPSKRGGLPKDLSIKAMLKMNLPPISGKTAKDTTVVIGEFMTWMETEGYPVTSGLKGILSSVKTPKRKDAKRRMDFSSDDLERLFQSDAYVKGPIKRASEYLIPLIALFTGARLGEIAQLHCSDIHEDQGVWVFDFNEDGEKQLKSETSSRLVPIHSTLLELGLLDFLKQRRKSSLRLFPEEERTAEGKFDAYGKRFATYRKKVGVVAEEGSMLDFHSFRHTVRTKLTEASVEESLIDDIIGHASEGRSIGRKTYTHTQLIPHKKEAIEKIVYALDFSKLKRWEHCRFRRDLPKK